jgi:calcium channel MID1
MQTSFISSTFANLLLIFSAAVLRSSASEIITPPINQVHTLSADAQANIGYEPNFPGFQHSIVARADYSPQALQNNVPANSTISQGQAQLWVFQKDQLDSAPSSDQPVLPPTDIVGDNRPNGAQSELKRRQSSINYYVTVNVCQQPSPVNPNPTGPPGPLQLYISLASTNTQPGPDADQQQQQSVVADGGYAVFEDASTGDVFFAVTAPSTPGFSGAYTYDITASIDAPYSGYRDYQDLFYVDSDTNAGLLVTNNLTVTNETGLDPGEQDELDALQTQWMNSPSPFSVFLHYQNDTQVLGLRKSWCGLKNYAQIKGIRSSLPSNVNASMTEIGGGFAKQQFYISDLNGSSSYYAVMALETNYTKAGPGTKGGGGIVWQNITFTTKSGKRLS